MLPAQQIQYLNFPQIPQELVDKLTLNFDQYQKVSHDPEVWFWSDSFNQEINEWGQKNICSKMYFAFHHMIPGSQIHKDSTKLKLNYLISLGGSNVITNFYDEDKTTILNSYCVEPHRWHLFKADEWHGVENIEPEKYRFMVTAGVF